MSAPDPALPPAAPSALRRGLPWLVGLTIGLGVFGFALGPLEVAGQYFVDFHPLALSLRTDVNSSPDAWVDAAQRWAQLALLIGVAASLRPWPLGVAIVACLMLVSPLWGCMWPLEVHWVLLGGAAVARWRGHQGLAGMLLGGSVFADPLLGYSIIVQYGARVAPLGPGLAFATAAVATVALLRAGDRWLIAIPPLGAATMFVSLVTSAGAIEEHRFTPPDPGECESLDVEVLNPLEGPEQDFLPYGVAAGPEFIAASGMSVVALFDYDGQEIVRLREAADLGRVEMVHWDGDELLAAPAGGTLRWRPNGTGEWDNVLYEQWAPGFPEILGIAVHGPTAWFSTVDYPILMREEPRSIWYVGGGTSGFTGFVRSIAGELVLTDIHSIRVLDPETLAVRRARRFPPWDVAVRHNVGDRWLYRMSTIARRIRVIDVATLETVRTIDVDIRLRYMGVSADDRYLLIADFFGGRAELRDATTGEILGNYAVGRRPRNIDWSERLGAFVGVSSCGLYKLTPPG